MAQITFLPHHLSYLQIPIWFVTDYMPQALGGYVKVYIYLLGLSSNPSSDSTSIEDIAKKLEMLHSEFLAALEYWQEKGVIHFSIEDELFEISFTTEKPEAPQSKPLVVKAPAPTSRTFIQQTRPLYTADELNMYRRHDSIAQLFMICEKYLGRMLSSTDQQVLYGLYDWLNMPLDLIEFLVEYCASNNHTHIRYIEKVALSWVDSGIQSVDDAKEQVSITKKYRTIFKALGMNSETITKQHRTLFDKWLETYKLDMAIILEGCKRTVTHTNKPTLNYLDRILTSWHESQVKTLADIEQLDKARDKEQNVQNTQFAQKNIPNARPLASKNPQFTTTYSHNWDLDHLDELAQEYLERNVYGGDDK
ncbi:MAG: DnaD domain protein [Cellulosilyticaceae bacterium]